MGSVVYDPFSVSCSYSDWLNEGPVTTVARGWPPTMALMTLACVLVVICIGWSALRTIRGQDARALRR